MTGSDALFFLVRVALALILACGLVAIGIYAGATQARLWLHRHQ